jgi:anti-sigma factor RsiW
MIDDRHLTEEERQTIADDTMPAAFRGELEKHLERCDACRDDVARLRDVLTQYRSRPLSPRADDDDLWTSIKSHIERDKVVRLGAVEPAPSVRRRRLSARHVATLIGIAAGIILTIIMLRPSHRIAVDVTASAADTAGLRLVADSVKAYEDEARILLNRLELERAMLRPDAASAIDRDLKVIDQAIAELQIAIKNDPQNRALRQLLASSYRQKIDLLKRAGNAT